MSQIIINGTLILNGNMDCDKNITVTSVGKIIPIPDEDLKKEFYCPTNRSFITANGLGRTITSLTGDVTVDGIIDGLGQGFESNKGPGCNSLLLSNFGQTIPGYGATHAGLGAVHMMSGQIYVIVEEFRLTSRDIENRYVTLFGRPLSPDVVVVNVISGPSMDYEIDYYVDRSFVRWDSRVLEGLLEVGDIIRVVYEGDTSPLAPEPKMPYGDHETPVSLGSGSGFYHDPELIDGEATNGGGAIKIVARSGIVSIDGSINMDGNNGYHAGGGSGGSIWIIAWNITGTGSMTSMGGGTIYEFGGGGGGGYVSLWHERSDTFTGFISVDGQNDGLVGKIFKKCIEPVLEEKFTGDIWNTKWWETQGDTTLNNFISITSPQDNFVFPQVESKFSLSGSNIQADVDYIPDGSETNFFNSGLTLFSDDRNWVEVSRRNGNIFGSYSENGYIGQTGIPFDSTNVTFRISKVDSTFLFQFYDSTSLPQTIFSEVLPGLSNKRFKVQLGIEKPQSSDNTMMYEYFRLTSTDEANRYVSFYGPTTDVSNVAMNIIGGSAQYYGMDFYVNDNKVKWDQSGLAAYTVPFTMITSEYFILDSTMINEAYLTLSEHPDRPENVALNIVHGTPQDYGTDFYVSGKNLIWDGLALESFLEVGDELRVTYYWTPWDAVPLEDLLIHGDMIRIIYQGDMTNNTVSGAFDNFRIYNGSIYNAETREPVVYVDPVYGSDASDGRQLTPIQNLFVATAWAKRGGTVVLYDGTHNPAEVSRKNLTIMGANGAKSVITTANVQDTTGSGWETNALSFYGSQSVVKNLTINSAYRGILVENTDNFEVSNNIFSLCTYPARFQKCDPLVARNFVSGGDETAFDFTSCPNAIVYSNVVADSPLAVYAGDSSGMMVLSNTFDNGGTAVFIDRSSTAVVASNNMTWNDVGIQRSIDSTEVYSFNNNFYATYLPYSGPDPDMTRDNISLTPLYVDRGALNFHLNPTSPDIGTGLSQYDFYYMDLDGASRADSSTYDIGAFMFIDGGHVPGEEYYVAGRGNDFVNFGGRNNPFRTLDKAMQVADSTVNVDGGHYDTYYLKLKSQNINLNNLTVYVEEQNHFLSYYTLGYEDLKGKYVRLPGVLKNGDYSNVAVNIVGGPAQAYGVDYIAEAGAITWNDLALDELLEIGDVLRVTYDGVIGPKAADTLTLTSHFSNYDQEMAIFVSPNGSDSSVLGGDGTNTGGNGTMGLPYRTVSRALQDSSVGSNIVLMAGEYPIFAGVDQRIIVPAIDRTGVPEKGLSRQYVEDLFNPRDFIGFGPVETDPNYWTLDSSGQSHVGIGGGFMAFTYDGTHPATATSVFTVTNDFEVQAELRNAIDPLFFNISGVDQTMSFR